VWVLQAAQDAHLAQHALRVLAVEQHIRDALQRHLRHASCVARHAGNENSITASWEGCHSFAEWSDGEGRQTPGKLQRVQHQQGWCCSMGTRCQHPLK